MPWKAGLAKIRITPQTPVWLAGFGWKRLPEGVLHDLWLKVLALESAGGRRAVLITSDFQGIPRSVYDHIARAAGEKYGLDRSQLMLTFSHNHCGPRLREDLVDYYPADETQIAVVEDYTARMESEITELIGTALSRLQPANLAFGFGAAGFAVNRRDNPRPPIIREAALQGVSIMTEIERMRAANMPLKGKVDHRVPVLTVRAENDRLLACVFGYACHPVTLQFNQWCGDFPGFAQLALEKSHPETMAMFIQGCGADQAPIPWGSVSLAEQYGNQLATAVENALAQPMRPLIPELQTAFAFTDLKYEHLCTIEDYRRAAQAGDSIRTRWAKRMLNKLEHGETLPTSFPYPVQTWRLGTDLMIIGLGGEAVVDYALLFSGMFGPNTWVCGYANLLAAYIPSRRVYEEGGYEGGPHIQEYGYHPADRWADDVEERVTETVRALAHRVGVTPYGSTPRNDDLPR